MGTKCAPSYAILFMSKFEEDFQAKRFYRPLVWWRYIDEIFMIWPHLREELYSFLEALNSQNRADFLDATVTKDEHGHIQTSLYTKPMDAHMYLHFSSYHPKHQKSSIPYNQAIRLRRICSTPELYQEAAHKLSENLWIRGYLKGLVKEAVDMAFQKDRSELLRTYTCPENKKENVIPFTITFNPYNPPIKRILQNNIHILQQPGIWNQSSKASSWLWIQGPQTSDNFSSNLTFNFSVSHKDQDRVTHHAQHVRSWNNPLTSNVMWRNKRYPLKAALTVKQRIWYTF